MDFPKGGSGSIVDALVRGVRKKGNKVCLNSPVEEILVENDKVYGVKLVNGKEIKVKQAIVSNADPYITNNFH